MKKRCVNIGESLFTEPYLKRRTTRRQVATIIMFKRYIERLQVKGGVEMAWDLTSCWWSQAIPIWTLSKSTKKFMLPAAPQVKLSLLSLRSSKPSPLCASSKTCSPSSLRNVLLPTWPNWNKKPFKLKLSKNQAKKPSAMEMISMSMVCIFGCWFTGFKVTPKIWKWSKTISLWYFQKLCFWCHQLMKTIQKEL